MDPNKTLELLRALACSFLEGDQSEYIEMAEHFTALDEWLSKGGYPPKDWV